MVINAPDLLFDQLFPATIQTVPPITVMFAKYPKVSEYDLSSVKGAVCGSAPLSKEIEDVVKTKLKLPCNNQGYGMTEIGVTHVNGKDTFKYKSVGKLLPLVEIKIVDVDTGKTCGVDEEGEIWIR
ncbi:luciferin 4-monooxygenase-like [Mercenaria mercenaria]|uniref:luciferin 4-monooxygenase-like n=1 Tax=Mercenaria mercenaria TaxID=6596 RepID=UPI00234F1BFD|nr:luciferin 4-monooxygenase-like [Mercenaria mercenaria]